MQIISELSDRIEETLTSAECYIKMAMEMREQYPAVATAFQRISIDNMNHVNILHEQVVAIINEYKKQNGDPPEKMQWVYDYLHKKHIERANEIKILQELFK